jgi:hypothetical protein
MKQKGFAPVIIILFLALVAALGYIGYLKGYFDNLIQKPEVSPSPLVQVSPSPTPGYTEQSSAGMTREIKENGLTCYENDKYFVIDAGDNSNFLIKYKDTASQKINCLYNNEDGDYEIKGWAYWYYKLQNNYLVIDSGTAPPPRGLDIYDLAKKQKIYENSYGSIISLDDSSIVFWKISDTEPTSENCPEKTGWEKEGLGAVIYEQVRLILASLEETNLNQMRCSATQ